MMMFVFFSSIAFSYQMVLYKKPIFLNPSHTQPLSGIFTMRLTPELKSKIDSPLNQRVCTMSENKPKLGSDCRVPVRTPPQKPSGSGT